MQPATTQTAYQLTNPYAAHASIPAVELQLLLLGAVTCFVVGILLAEQTTLRRMISSAADAIARLLPDRAQETA